MAGKDLIDSVKLSSRICRILGSRPPEGFNYELFLDERGQKISKSKGNGLTIDEWLRYGTRQSLELFMYRDPRAAKRLYFDVIPRHVDDYLQLLDAYPRQGRAERYANPVWHIHDGAPEPLSLPVTYGLVLNLVNVLGTHEEATIMGFLARYAPDLSAAQEARLRELVALAINYYWDFVRPRKNYREPTAQERAALLDLMDKLALMDPEASAEAVQHEVYETGKRHAFGNLRDWFRALYEVLMGQSEGPRFGTFVAVYGLANTCELIRAALDGRLGVEDAAGSA
jgi:lysyl-tRNA synthetase class 1